MSNAVSLLDLDLSPGRPAILHADPGGDAPRWAAGHRDPLRSLVAAHGAVLVRGLGLQDAGTAGAVFFNLTTGLMAETEPFAPRHVRAEHVYSATPWPAAQPMCMHHELSYTLEFPAAMLFACLTAPTDGGATPLADATAVLDALPADLVERFERDGWLLVRTYNDDIGASWATAFGTDDRAAVERYCRANSIAFEWQPDDGLRTRQRRSAVLRHPGTGARSWFNQIAFLSEWTMDPEVREFLVDSYGADGLPFTTRYGDGSPIDEDVVTRINAAYDDATVREPWQAGDLLVVDNIRTAHGRDPFTGPRDVVVALADAVAVR